MKQLDELVLETIQNFVENGMLFTALDVSNCVKNALPFARHREVRDLVRSFFQTEIEPAGYARTPINVILSDGSSANAILYHPLADSWDLDVKYDTQKRTQSSAIPTKNGVTTVITTPTPPVSTPPSNRDVWNNLFQSQTSLFPNR